MGTAAAAHANFGHAALYVPAPDQGDILCSSFGGAPGMRSASCEVHSLIDPLFARSTAAVVVFPAALTRG